MNRVRDVALSLARCDHQRTRWLESHQPMRWCIDCGSVRIGELPWEETEGVRYAREALAEVETTEN
jgi:hypothetical protein